MLRRTDEQLLKPYYIQTIIVTPAGLRGFSARRVWLGHFAILLGGELGLGGPRRQTRDGDARFFQLVAQSEREGVEERLRAVIDRARFCDSRSMRQERRLLKKQTARRSTGAAHIVFLAGRLKRARARRGVGIGQARRGVRARGRRLVRARRLLGFLGRRRAAVARSLGPVAANAGVIGAHLVAKPLSG